MGGDAGQTDRDHERGDGWLTLGEAARYLGVAQSTVRSWSDVGRVPTFRTPGGHRRFRQQDLDSFMNGVHEDDTPRSRDGGAALVLVVDDDPVVRALVRSCLETAGFDVVEGESAQEGIQRINDRIPDLMMIDVRMPGIDGWEMLRRVREKLDVEDLPVIVFSGEVSGDELGRAAHHGAQGYLCKPFDPFKLVTQAMALLSSGGVSR